MTRKYQSFRFKGKKLNFMSTVGSLSGFTTFSFPCIESECMESSLMSGTHGSTRVSASYTSGTCKVLSSCVSSKEESWSRKSVNLYHLDLWSTSPITIMELSCISSIEIESDVNSTFLPF
jgi:hypothetical protein